MGDLLKRCCVNTNYFSVPKLAIQ